MRIGPGIYCAFRGLADANALSAGPTRSGLLHETDYEFYLSSIAISVAKELGTIDIVRSSQCYLCVSMVLGTTRHVCLTILGDLLDVSWILNFKTLFMIYYDG